jgi:hypothetical protein
MSGKPPDHTVHLYVYTGSIMLPFFLAYRQAGRENLTVIEQLLRQRSNPATISWQFAALCGIILPSAKSIFLSAFPGMCRYDEA